MTICGIIAEYNPFHNGHIHHIQETRKQTDCDLLIAVMSGNFVQRGEPAVTDKWTRSRAAVENGVDIVLELPYLYTVQSASVFAKEAVRILAGAGISMLSFGSECGNADNLADIASTPADPDRLRELMRDGMSYPRAYSLLTSAMYPNDILAVAYIKALAGTGIRPVVIPREGMYNDTSTDVRFPSAAAVRSALRTGAGIREATPMADQLLGGPCQFPEKLYPFFRTLVLTTPRSRLKDFFLVSEGIEKTLKNAALECDTYEQFLNSAVSYRYTASRIRRIMTHIMNGVTKQEAAAYPRSSTVRVLAFNDNGRRWLHEQKKQADVSFAVRFGALTEQERELEYRTALLYASTLSEPERSAFLKKEISGAQYIR